jgi:hypothetical protein
MKKSSLREMQGFLRGFLVTIARCIPHHLNEEIFQLTEEVLELNFLLKKDTGNNFSSRKLREDRKERKLHVRCMIEALTDKYTMRSKAHKRLTKYFIQRVVLEESLAVVKKEEGDRERDRIEA